jgi:LPS O-antigen subunit length determinant protein (WzzB/FepE family)
MTLIVKELIVRGIVSVDNSPIGESPFAREELEQYLEQMKKEVEKECIEKILQKMELKTTR